jgi:hypothetical protein
MTRKPPRYFAANNRLPMSRPEVSRPFHHPSEQRVAKMEYRHDQKKHRHHNTKATPEGQYYSTVLEKKVSRNEQEPQHPEGKCDNAEPNRKYNVLHH